MIWQIGRFSESHKTSLKIKNVSDSKKIQTDKKMAEVEAAPVIEQAASDVAAAEQPEKMETEVKKQETDDCNYPLEDIDETAKVLD